MHALPRPRLWVLWLVRVALAFFVGQIALSWWFFYSSSDDALRTLFGSTGPVDAFRTTALEKESFNLLVGAAMLLGLFFPRPIPIRWFLGLTASVSLAIGLHRLVKTLLIMVFSPDFSPDNLDAVDFQMMQVDALQFVSVVTHLCILWIALRPPRRRSSDDEVTFDHHSPNPANRSEIHHARL